MARGTSWNRIIVISEQPVSMPLAFRCDSLRKSYGKRAVLSGLGLSIGEGETVGLLGANGAGKTTLLKVLLGLTPFDGGVAMIGGERSTSLSAVVRAQIGYVPQMPSQFSWLTGKSMLRYVGAFYPNFDWEYTRALTERWKVSVSTPIGLLSPGQQQRLAIARALGHRPRYLVLDEPIAALDPATRIAVIDELAREHEARAISILFSSHITGDLERLCSRFIVLSGGAIVFDESRERCRTYRRATVSGDEQLLAQMSCAGCLRVRKTQEGQRVVVGRQGDIADLARNAPAGVSVRDDDGPLESIVSEWMQ